MTPPRRAGTALLLGLGIAQLAAPFFPLLSGLGAGIWERSAASGPPSPASPAPYAFGVWFLIFLLSILWAARALFVRGSFGAACHGALVRGMTPVLALGTLWMLLFQFLGDLPALGPVVVLMLVLALRAYALFLSRAGDFAPADRKILSAALGTFSGWLTLAGFLSVLLTLEKLFPALPLRSPGAALTALGSASGLALFFILRRGAGLPYGLTLLWGLLGVLAANGPSSPVFWGAAALGAVLAGTLLLSRRG